MAFMIPAFLSKPLAFLAENWAKIKLAATVITIGVGVKGFAEARALMAKGQDILGQKTSQGGKIPVILGRRRVGSTVAFMHTADNRSKDLFVVYALSVGDIDQIELDTIEINGVSIKDPKVFRQGYYAGSDKISSGAGSLCTASQIGNVQESNAGGSGTDPARRYRMVFNAHHGADDQTVDPMLTASVGTQWTSNHRMRGIAYLACSFEYDSRGMFSSIPQLTVVCRGKKLYDPRKDGSISGGTGSHRYDTPSTFEWSDNAALCLLDYMRDDNYGKGLAQTDINLQSFQTAASTAEAKKDTPDYNGSYAASVFSGTSGTNVLNVNADTWETLKIGGFMNLKDSGGSTDFTDNEIIDASRWQPYDSSTVYQAVLRNALGSSYTNESGQMLVQVERFHCNGVIDTNKNVLENTQDLLANMRGILNYIDGKYEITLEDTGSSSFTVTDDHIIGESGITVNYEDKAQKANKVVVQFFNALKKYEMDTVTVLHDSSPSHTSDDGGEELELVVDFPHIVNQYVAYNMGKAILGRSRNQMTISFTAVPELYKVKVGDIITVAYSPVGFSGKLFRVEAMALQPDGLVALQAIEYLDIYTWQAPPQENIEPLVTPVADFAVKPPAGLAFTDSGSSSTGRAFLTWSEPTDFPNYEYRVNLVDSSSNKLVNRIVDTEFVDLEYLPLGSNYVASVSSINSVGQESDAATLTFSVTTEPVATTDVKNDAITTVKIDDLAVTNAKINDLNATKITAGTINTARLNVSDIISTGNIIVSGDNVSTLTNNAGYVDSSGAASAAPVQSVAGATGAVSASTIISAGSIVVQGDNISSLTNNENFIDGSQVNANVTSISGGVIDTGTINADVINIDNVTLDTSGGELIIKTNGVSTTQIASKAVSSFTVATGAKSYWFTDNLSETAIVTTAVFQAPANTDNPFAVIGNTSVVANSGSSSDFVQLRLYRRSASTSGGVSSATYVNIADYKMYGDSAEAIQTIADSDSYTANYYYQYKMTLQTQGTSTIGGQTRSYGASVLQVFVTYR